MNGGSGRRRPSHALAAAVWLAVITLATARLAAAQAPSPPETSDQLFRRGRMAAQAGDCAAALPFFEQSQRLEPAVGTLLNMAICEERLALSTAARAHLAEALVLAAPDDPRRGLIQERIAKLDLEIVRHVDEPAAASAASAGRANEQAQAAVPLVQAPPAPSGSGRRRVGHLLLGAGAAAVVVSLAVGAVVIHEKAEVGTHCQQAACDDQGLSAARWGARASVVSTVAGVLGLASVASSTYLLLTVPDQSGGHPLVAVTGSF
jgi:hypothetical protein